MFIDFIIIKPGIALIFNLKQLMDCVEIMDNCKIEIVLGFLGLHVWFLANFVSVLVNAKLAERKWSDVA